MLYLWLRFPVFIVHPVSFIKIIYQHDQIMIGEYLYIDKSAGRGRGVFTRQPIPARTVVERSPVIVLSPADTDIVDVTKLHNYIFNWGVHETRSCIALGYCSLYNHSYHPNCEYEMDYESRQMAIITLCDIAPGAELFINYNGRPDDQTPVWFDVKRKEA